MNRKLGVFIVLTVVFILVAAGCDIQAFGSPKSPKPVAPEEASPQKPVPTLTEAEKTRAINIIKEHDNLKKILERANWEVSHIGARHKASQKTGASVHIKFKPSVWIEGEFNYPAGEPAHKVRLWAGGSHVSVDFEKGKVIAVDPGLGKPEEKKPLNNREQKAEEIALRHPLVKSLGKDFESYLGGVWYTFGHPQGLAIFEVRASEKEVVLIAVDLGSLKVVEEPTGRLWNAQAR